MKSGLFIVSFFLLTVQFNRVITLSLSDLIDDLSQELEGQFASPNSTSDGDGTIGKYWCCSITQCVPNSQ